MPRPRLTLCLLLALAISLGAACDDTEGPAPAPTPTAMPAQPTARPTTSARATPVVPFRTNRPFLTALPTGYRIEALLDGLDKPSALAATPDGRLLVAEQNTGRVRVVRDGRLLDEPWFEVPVYFAEDEFIQELGLVGIAVDPLFEENRFVYLYYSEQDQLSREQTELGRRQDELGGRRTVLARLRDVDGRGTELRKLVTIDFAPQRIHIGGGIAFDGDDAILLGVGDHERKGLAPRLSEPVGKVLRIDREGNALPDNPFVGREGADPRVYTYGLRNPFGVAVDPASGRKFITENKDAAGDAVYELEAGGDYGWPAHFVAFREPLVIYEEPLGMAAITVYDSDVLPAFTGDLFYCTHHAGGGLHWSEPEEVTGFDISKRDRLIAPGCSSGVTVGADGFLYFLAYGDGKLLRISR